MFDMGFSEITLIFVILLIVVGPERLPKLARTAGIWIGKARSMVASVKAEVEQELKVSELKQSIAEQTGTEDFKELKDSVKSLNTDMKSMAAELRSSVESTTQAAEAVVTPQLPEKPKPIEVTGSEDNAAELVETRTNTISPATETADPTSPSSTDSQSTQSQSKSTSTADTT